MNLRENTHDCSLIINECETEHIYSLLGEVRNNLATARDDWKELQAVLGSSLSLEAFNQNDVIIKRFFLQNLSSESEKVKVLLFNLLSQNEEMVSSRMSSLLTEVNDVKSERDKLQSDMMHWKSQYETALSDIQKEKQGQLNLRTELQELSEKLSEQSEFCCSLGAACCTLLWRISRQESAIETLVSGCKSTEFLELICVAIQGYLITYRNHDWPGQNTDEAIFILSVCGIITNMAASAQGREYLASTPLGCDVIDTFINFIVKAPIGKSAQIKNLMLMSLYNFSINCKGIRYLCSKRELIPLIVKHLKEEKDQDNQLRTLKLLQSLASDETYASVCMSEIMEHLSKSFLQEMIKSSNKDIQGVAQEILSDMRNYQTEH
ncbi:Heat shock factor 2-binding protein [Bulinus truncatus]|nr:Heat shock factor 2-binding protein [Bulinus truncatus]